MRKILTSAIVLLGLLAFSLPAYAYPVDTLITSVDPANYPNPKYWGPGAVNPGQEEAWLEGVLGENVDYIDKNEAYFVQGAPGYDAKSLDGWDPGFAWTYAVVKYDGYLAAFEDQGDNLVTIPGIQGPYNGTFSNGISHITFFGSTGVTLPEPGTMILLGLGLLGLGIVVRKRS